MTGEWEAAGKTAAGALGALQEGHGSYKLCCRLYHESLGNPPTNPPNWSEVTPNALQAHPHIPHDGQLPEHIPSGSRYKPLQTARERIQKVSPTLQDWGKHTNLSIHTVLRKANGKLSASGFAGLREGVKS